MNNTLTTLLIEKVVSKGEGLARDGNKIWFVPMSLPGEKIVATPITIKKQFIKGEVVEIITPSPHRVTPFCPYYGICGGCDFQHVEYLEGVKIKEKIIIENLERIGHIDTNSFTLLPSITGSPLHYRGRVKFSLNQREETVGFLSRGTHDVVDITSCPLLSPSLNELLNDKRDLLWDKAKKIDPFKKNSVITISAFEGDNGLVTLDESEVSVTLLDKKLYVNANVFFQSNKEMLEKMGEIVKEWTVGETVVDLYSGIGTFASLVENDKRTVFAVESDKKCIALAQKHLKYTSFITTDATKWLKNRSSISCDTLIVDPPRVGLEPSLINSIGKLNPRHVIYISCDSATFSRDASLLEKVGYTISTLVFVDMYPHTSHMETVCLLERK